MLPMCPMCSTGGFFGGLIGGYFGIHPPKKKSARIASALITATLITITFVALKVFFNISLCRNGKFNFENIVLIGLKTTLLGIVYSIAVNYLLNKFLAKPPRNSNLKSSPSQKGNSHSCCH